MITCVLWRETKPRWQRAFLWPCFLSRSLRLDIHSNHLCSCSGRTAGHCAHQHHGFPCPSPMLLALSTSSASESWTPPGLPQPCSAPAPEQDPHHSVCDISFSAITFPISELNSRPVLLFQKGTFNQVGISRIWDCEKHVGGRQNTWVAFEGDFIELVLLALHICVRTHTHTHILSAIHTFGQVQCQCSGG